MTQEGDAPGATDGAVDDLDGVPLADAVDAVAADRDLDREAVRVALEYVTDDDGVVDRHAAEAELAHVSKVVATPETRVELAADAVEEARASAEGVDDLAAVASRLRQFEARLATAEETVARLGPDLQAISDRLADGSLFEVGRALRRLRSAANDAQQRADDLSLDAEAFERWLANPDQRYDELAGDVDALEDGLDRLADALDDLEDGRAWLEAGVDHRVLALLHADLRAELADMRALDDRKDQGTSDRRDELEARLADAERRLDDLRNTVQATGEGHEDERETLDAFEAAVADLEPPVPWGEVEAAEAEYRPGRSTGT